jgi:hypothetical protein
MYWPGIDITQMGGNQYHKANTAIIKILETDWGQVMWIEKQLGAI